MKKAIKSIASLAIAGLVLTIAPFNTFADTGITTTRLFGSDRVGTAIAVADAGWTTADTAILAPSGDANIVDALAAAPLAGKTSPILLTDNNSLNAATKAELVKLGVKNVYVVGAINQTVVDQVNALDGVTATVLKGSDRLGTAAAISSKLTAPAGSFVVGYGALADALSVASYAAANNYSILVANPDGSLPASEAAYQGSTVYIIGGPTLVADIPGATRIFGADRIATNQAVLKALTYNYDHIYVANATDVHLVDSLLASSLAAKSNSPIVLSDINGFYATATSLQSKLASASVVTALGGHTLVSDAVVAEVTELTTPPTGGWPQTTGSIGVAADLSGFNQYYPLLAAKMAPAETLKVVGTETPISNHYDAALNANFVVAPFSSYPAMSTIPSQGLTINMLSDKNGVITNVDGYTLVANPTNVAVNLNSAGEVSVNDVKLWKAQSGFKVVGYLPGLLSGSATLIEENLSDLTKFVGVKVSNVGSAGLQVAAWTLPTTSLPGNFEEFLGFNVNSTGQLQPLVASYFANKNKFFPYSTSVSPLAVGVFAPVEVAQVYASDRYTEASVVTISNSLNNKTATVITDFTPHWADFTATFKMSPSSVNEALGNSQILTLNCQDFYGNPIANQTLYLRTGFPGLWITQVNGQTLTGSVNLGTSSSPSMQTVNTPVPLFSLGYLANATAYPRVSVTGLTASNLNDITSPVIVLTTGADGTISITLADGHVNYVANIGSTTAVNSPVIDPGIAIAQQHLEIFFDSAQTSMLGSVLLNWGSPNAPATEEISLNQTALSLEAGGAPARLVATVVPGNTTNQAVIWSSSNSNVNVATNGVVTPVSAGTATITATTEDGSESATCTVTVAIAQTTVDPAALSLPGTTLQDGTVGIPYTAGISATGGTPPYSYVASSLPKGLTLGTDGTISGTSTASGTTSFTVYVIDSTIPTARTASQTFSFTGYQEIYAKKPVIYLYPTTEQPISVKLIFNGKFTDTRPEYKHGWEVIAHPDGTILNSGDNKEYSYLFWEGILANNSWDMTKGFVVAGKDTKDFLQDKLSLMGLTPKEYNDFIAYWLPKMQDNPYNLITFANEEYEQRVHLSIAPNPDSVLRVFMVYKPIIEKIDIPSQQLTTFDRTGFSVVEWGGSEVR